MNVEDVNETIWQELSHLETYDGAKREHFAAGLPIYYWEENTPRELTIKEYPDGRRELVRYQRNGDEVVTVL